jgi:ubiquinone/menaquinone biosynthesis C-methylase UbiE
MSKPVDLYDSHYGNVETDVHRAIRAEAFGEDLGQTSWITLAECDDLCGWLDLNAEARVLEVACGSGGVSTRIAERFKASVVGVDINEAAVRSASARAEAHGVSGRSVFRVVDADGPLPFSDNSFDVVFCNDAINHLKNRRTVLADWCRVLRPGGRCLYTDPIVVTGCLSNAEIASRSSIGWYLFTPAGANEVLLKSVGFRILRVQDCTGSVSEASKRWRDARAKRRDSLVELEGEERYEKLQDFLSTVHVVASERRLSRFAFLAQK